MSSSETWTIRRFDGSSVAAVEVVPRGACYAVVDGVDAVELSPTPRMAAVRYAARCGWDGEVLAPGEKPRSELELELASLRAELKRAAGDPEAVEDVPDLIGLIRARAVRASRAAVRLAWSRVGGVDGEASQLAEEALAELAEAYEP